MDRTWFAAFALVFALAITSGCDEDRKPPLAVFIVLTSDHNYLINQQRFDRSGFEAEMHRVADENRRPLTGQVRAFVYIDTENSADYYLTDALAGFCQRLGYMNVVRSNAGMK